MYGFENDVAYNNYQYYDLLNALWEDKLAFVYFENSFWMTHPVCVLGSGESGCTNCYSTDFRELSNAFQKFLTNETHKELLLEDGIRPYGMSSEEIESLSTVLTSTYGVNPSISSGELTFPSYDTISSIRTAWQDLKEAVYLRILLDVSFEMNTQISGKSITRWAYAVDGLDYFAEVLEDNAIVEIVCFAQLIVECGTSAFPVNSSFGNNTLEYTREDVTSYIADELTLSGQEDVAVFDAINETITDLRQVKNEYDGDNRAYNYVLVVISEDDTSSDITTDELLEQVGINYSPNEVHIFAVNFWGESGSETESVFEEITIRTNGEHYETTSDMPSILEEIGYYF